MQSHTGVLLVNLGTPNSPSNKDVFRYLIEFLTDRRVIDTSWLNRQLLVRGVIVPSRYRQSARFYRAIWTPQGSPLKVYGYQVKDLLQKKLGPNFSVELAMRYQTPSIEEGITRLIKQGVDRLVIFPLFPQYASATTGSVHEKVMEVLSKLETIPEVHFVNNYATHPALIRAFCAVAQPFALESYDHILLSFHGLPERHLLKADQNAHCLKTKDCCKNFSKKNSACYSAQCYATANALTEALGIPPERYSIAFQSRLGKDPWIQPYTSAVIDDLARQGKKNVLVFCPAFVCDCLETIHEIGIEYAEEFKHAGGTRLDLVPGLNADPAWIDALAEMISGKNTN